jgi:hypothetical protein
VYGQRLIAVQFKWFVSERLQDDICLLCTVVVYGSVDAIKYAWFGLVAASYSKSM